VEVAVTGIGVVTSLGCRPDEVLNRMLRGERAIQASPFGAAVACPVYSPLGVFDAAEHFPDNKTLRLMNRDAQMATVAARLAMRDAGVAPGELYPAEEIALYGATGLCGMPPGEIASLLRNAAADDGSLDLRRFGEVALRRIRPVLSFKILANMPICFVSIFENLRGPNAVYTPWEGQAAQAIAAGVRAVADGESPCAVVGGCDVKTHALAFLSLQQFGVFDSWRSHNAGSVPGEGAAFVVLEERAAALRRGSRVYATVQRHAAGSVVCRQRSAEPISVSSDCRRRLLSPICDVAPPPSATGVASYNSPCEAAAHDGDNGSLTEVLTNLLRTLDAPGDVQAVLAGDDDYRYHNAEQDALEAAGIRPVETLRPKQHLGNTFAASAAVQLALAALLTHRGRRSTLANCFGHGTEQAAFLLEAT
jgi:3-oxoacyl-(acyl-carrier-protein) synthase